MIPIPVGLKYTAIQKGSRLKEVTCENCGKEYVYVLEVTAFGQSHSLLGLQNEAARMEAAAKAEKIRNEVLAKGCSVAPCPECGWIQRHMFTMARDWMPQAPYRMFVVGIIVLCLAGVFLPCIMSSVVLPAMQHKDVANPVLYWTVFVGLVVAGLALTLLGRIRNKRWNPNLLPLQDRLKLADEGCFTRERYEKLIADLNTLNLGSASPSRTELGTDSP